MRILSFDLGDFNAESAWTMLDKYTGETSAGTVMTATAPLDALLREIDPDVVLCEACTMAALLRDVVQAAIPGATRLAKEQAGLLSAHQNKLACGQAGGPRSTVSL